jgi:hypothetical protein
MQTSKPRTQEGGTDRETVDPLGIIQIKHKLAANGITGKPITQQKGRARAATFVVCLKMGYLRSKQRTEGDGMEILTKKHQQKAEGGGLFAGQCKGGAV